VTHALADDAPDLRVLFLAHVDIFKLLEALLLFGSHLLYFIKIEVLNASKLTSLVTHNLELSWTSRDNKCSISLEIAFELCLKLSELLLLGLLYQALASHCEVLSRLQVLLLPPQFLEVFFDSLYQVLGNRRLRVRAVFANADARLGMSEVELLEDLVLREGVGTLVGSLSLIFLLSVTEEALLLVLILSVFLGDLEAAREARPLLQTNLNKAVGSYLEHAGLVGAERVFRSDDLEFVANLRNMGGRISRTHS